MKDQVFHNEIILFHNKKSSVVKNFKLSTYFEAISIGKVGYSISERLNLCIRYWSLYCHINFPFLNSSQTLQWLSVHPWCWKIWNSEFIWDFCQNDSSHDLLRMFSFSDHVSCYSVIPLRFQYRTFTYRLFRLFIFLFL